MINNNRGLHALEMLKEREGEYLLFKDYDYKEAFIGLSHDDRAIYDYDLMVECLVQNENMSYDDAIEWIDYNTLRALDYFSEEKKPIVLFRMVDAVDEIT